MPRVWTTTSSMCTMLFNEQCCQRCAHLSPPDHHCAHSLLPTVVPLFLLTVVHILLSPLFPVVHILLSPLFPLCTSLFPSGPRCAHTSLPFWSPLCTPLCPSCSLLCTPLCRPAHCCAQSTP